MLVQLLFSKFCATDTATVSFSTIVICGLASGARFGSHPKARVVSCGLRIHSGSITVVTYTSLGWFETGQESGDFYLGSHAFSYLKLIVINLIL